MSITTSAGSGVSRHLQVVKLYFKKPMCLVIAILSLVTLVSEFMLSAKSADWVKELAETVQAVAGEGVDVSAGSNNIVSYIISGVITLCLFMIFISSVSPKGGPGLWFTILHGLSVLELILTALGTLVIAVLEVVFIFSAKTIIQFAVNQGLGGMGEMTDEQLEMINRSVGVYRTTLIIIFVITIVICGLTLYYINSQTAFLKSVGLTCKNPQLKSKGAVPFGNLSIFFGIFMLIGTVIFYLTVGNSSSSVLADMDAETSAMIPDFTAIIVPYMIYSISSALFMLLKGYFAKGWAAFAKDNEDMVYETAGAATRVSDASPMPTYKSNNRASEARQQSQPYLIGEEEDNKTKKSAYIPEELQQDYSDQGMYGGGQPVGGQPFMGDPYGNPYGGQPVGGNPYGGQPMGGDPFAQSPMGGNPYGGQPGGNPYGGQGGGYNNGMM